MNRKSNRIILVSFVVYVFFILIITLALRDLGARAPQISTNALTILTVIAILLSAIAFIAPWLVRGGRIPISNLPRWFNRLAPNDKILILGYIFLASPIVYGLVLYFAGSSIFLYYGFLSTSIVVALIWGFSNRKHV